MDDAIPSHDDINYLKALLAQRDLVIATHARQLIQRDKLLTERDQLLATREQRIAEYQATVTQREQIIVEQRSTVATLTQQRDEYQLEKLRLEMRLAKLLKQVYGPRADRLSDPAQLLLDFARRL